MAGSDPLLAPITGAAHHEVGGVVIDIAPAGEGRVKRVIYPAGFRWSKDMKAISGTRLCMHAHVGFLVKGAIHMQYGDGCIAEFTAPQAVVIDPGHDGWVVGDEPAVLIEFDFLGETVKRFGLPSSHTHQPK